MRERYFERRQIKEAIAFAEEGGIAIHRNFDSYHGSTMSLLSRPKISHGIAKSKVSAP